MSLLETVDWDDIRESSSGHFCFLDSEKSPTPEDQVKIVRDLGEVLPDYDVAQYFGSQPTIFDDYDHLTVAIDEQSSGVVGLVACRWMSVDQDPFLYIWTAMLGHAWQRSGLFMQMVTSHLENIDSIRGIPTTVATKTYNPAVYSILRRVSSLVEGATLYPEIPQTQQPQAMESTARRVAEVVCPSLAIEFDVGRVVGGQGVLAPDFFPGMPFSTDPDVHDHFAKCVTRDDQILCVLDLSPRARSQLVGVISDRLASAGTGKP
jgi:hypothetical protein